MQPTLEIRSIEGSKFIFKVNPKHTVGSLKKVLSAKLNLDQKLLHFVYKKTELQNQLTVDQLSIEPDTYIIYYESHLSTDDILKSPPPEPIHIVKQESASLESAKAADQEIDPDQLEDYVAFLHNMGFQKMQCLNALKYTHYQLSYAADLLCTGEIPKDFTNSEFEKKFSTVIDKLKEKKISQERLDVMATKFTHEEKKSIRNLVELGVSEDQAIQTYIALDKNEQAATNILISMLE